MVPPLAMPKSYQVFLSSCTLNEGVLSCRKGERYHSPLPRLQIGSQPSRDKKMAKGIFLISSIIGVNYFEGMKIVCFRSIDLIYTLLNYTVLVQ